MANEINGDLDWGQVPVWYTSGTGSEMTEQQYGYNSAYLVSANNPIIYQAVWTDPSGEVTDGLNEQYVPKDAGDIVNVVFNVYATTEYPTPSTSTEWDKIATIRKSRDIPNQNMATGTIPNSQSFTIDISRVVSDQLSYTLVPIGKGSFETQEFGGMNGGAFVQDNIVETVSPYNLSRNGAYRALRIWANIEVLDASGGIVTSDDTLGVYGITLRTINSVTNFNESAFYDNLYILNKWGASETSLKKALTQCPNEGYDTNSARKPDMFKKVSSTDQAEWLYFYVKEAFDGGESSYNYGLYEVYGTTYNAAGAAQDNFVLGSTWPYPDDNDPTDMKTRIQSDISHAFTYKVGDTSDTKFNQGQNQIAVQNVAPGYINDHAYPPQTADYPYSGTQFSPIDSDVAYYRVYVRGGFYDGAAWQFKRHSNVYYYRIDDSGNGSLIYNNVRFHWLNPMGGIDSYTARRNITEGVGVSKSLITTPLPNRRYHQGTKDSSGTDIDRWSYYSDTNRGFDTYKGGREVLNVEATLNNTVYTEPLNASEAKWLREIFTSPNVWIETPSEKTKDAAYMQNAYNDTLRPVATKYTPVIITNSNIVSTNQEEGLVSFNIEYTLSQDLPTQRN